MEVLSGWSGKRGLITFGYDRDDFVMKSKGQQIKIHLKDCKSFIDVFRKQYKKALKEIAHEEDNSSL